MYQNHLDKAAAARDKQGQDGNWLRQSIQNRLGFSDSDFAPIRESAQRLAAQISDVNSRAAAIAKSDRALYGGHPVPAGANPPGRAKLLALNQEREDDINDEIQRLNDALGPERASKLRDFVDKAFSTNLGPAQVHPQPLLPPKGTSQTAQPGVQP